jgi:large subunit ribosomal protein L7/L12
VIHAVRQLTGARLREAVALVDGLPAVLLQGVDPDTAERARVALENVGASTRIQ